MEPTSPPRKNVVLHRSARSEREIADARLGRFQLEGSRGQAMTRQIYPGGELTRRSLYSFSSILSALSGVPLERDMTRRRELLIKWLDEHHDALEPYLRFIELRPA
jgi:hypothetical protein